LPGEERGQRLRLECEIFLIAEKKVMNIEYLMETAAY
jgi:hypothetical protein